MDLLFLTLLVTTYQICAKIKLLVNLRF